jgi:hypothetical protein
MHGVKRDFANVGEKRWLGDLKPEAFRGWIFARV